MLCMKYSSKLKVDIFGKRIPNVDHSLAKEGSSPYMRDCTLLVQFEVCSDRHLHINCKFQTVV